MRGCGLEDTGHFCHAVIVDDSEEGGGEGAAEVEGDELWFRDIETFPGRGGEEGKKKFILWTTQ